MTLPALDRAVATGRLAQLRNSRKPMFRKLAKLAKLDSALNILENSSLILVRN